MLRIGDFSKLAQVSVHTLRHYDDCGLLKPVQVDAQTGYRYYAVEQLARLNRILALRGLGLSLEEIALMLDENLSIEHIRGIFKLKQAQLTQHISEEQAKLNQVEARLRQLEVIEQPGDAADVPVSLKKIESEPVIAHRGVMPVNDGGDRLALELMTHVIQHKIRVKGSIGVMFHDETHQEQHADIEVFVPLISTVPAIDRFRLVETPELLVAAVVHQGAPPTRITALKALLTWVEANGYQACGGFRSIHLRFRSPFPEWNPAFTTDSAEQFVTEIQIPVMTGAIRSRLDDHP